MALDTIVTGSKLTTLANAIRTKGGTSAQLTLDGMAQAVADIPTGGGGFDFSQVKGKRYYGSLMFENLDATSLDLSGLDTSTFETLSYMFENCMAITSLDISSFDVSAAEAMQRMFGNCSALRTITLPTASNITALYDISHMFNNCSALQSIDMSTMATSGITTMSYMFSGCSSLQYANLATIGTGLRPQMNNMFSNCSQLQSVNLASIETANATMSNMFSGCTNLTDIIWSQKSSVQPMPQTPANIGFTSTMKIYVPDDLVASYKEATNWSTIASQIYSINDLPAALKTLYGIS